ncbi:MAG: hypothetical protein ACJ79H_20445 [Myxococcales bacterium]
MTRLGMVVLGLTALAAAIAVAVGIAIAPSQESSPVELTPAQVAELRSTPAVRNARTAPANDDDEDGGAQALPGDGDGEDGPGS